MKIFRLKVRGLHSRARSNLRDALSLVEVALVLIITTAALAAGAQVYSEYLRAKTNQATAEHMQVVSSAYSRYLYDNSGHIISLAKASPTRDVVDVVTIEELVDEGYLHEGFRGDGALNPFGQKYVFYSRFHQEGSDPDKGRLESFVYTEGGNEIDIKDALAISQLVGAGGAFVDGEHNVRSSYGDFQLSLSDISASSDTTTGHLVSAMFFDESSVVTSDFLYRVEADDPSLNVMNTNLGMGGFSIDDVENINAAGEVKANELAANTLSASSATIPDLHGDTRVHGRIESGSLATGDATVTELTASSTNVSGNARSASATVTGALSAGSASVSGSLSSGSLSTGTLRASSVSSTGRMTADEFIQLNRIVTENTACSPNGLLARNAAGAILSCQSGTWRKAGSSSVADRVIRMSTAATVSCASDEVVIGGGYYCDDTARSGGSYPYGNGWRMVCIRGTPGRVYAICAKR